MAGLVPPAGPKPLRRGEGPAIHIFLARGTKDVDARHPSPPKLRRATSSLGRRSFSEDGKAGHDELKNE